MCLKSMPLEKVERKPPRKRPESPSAQLGRCFSEISPDLIRYPGPGSYAPSRTKPLGGRIYHTRERPQLDWIAHDLNNPAPGAYTLPRRSSPCFRIPTHPPFQKEVVDTRELLNLRENPIKPGNNVLYKSPRFKSPPAVGREIRITADG